MADISSIKTPNGSSYNIKDSSGRTTASNAPVLSSYLSVQTKSKSNVTVSAGSTKDIDITITRSGYTPIGIVGVILEGNWSDGCHIYRAYLNTSTTARIGLRNRLAAGTADSTVKVTVYVLYKLD